MLGVQENLGIFDGDISSLMRSRDGRCLADGCRFGVIVRPDMAVEMDTLRKGLLAPTVPPELFRCVGAGAGAEDVDESELSRDGWPKMAPSSSGVLEEEPEC